MKRPDKKIRDKLVMQVFICIVLAGVIVVMERADFNLTNQAMAVFQNHIDKDYTVSEIAEGTVTLGKAIVEKPAEVYAKLMERSGSEDFIMPTDELTVSVFESGEEGTASGTGGAITQGAVIDEGTAVSENTLEFVSEDEIVVYAAKGGVVAEIVDNEDGTKTLMLVHDSYITTKYMGCTEVYVKELQRVKKGEIIASVNSGKLNKLRFEIWYQDAKANPKDYLDLKE